MSCKRCIFLSGLLAASILLSVFPVMAGAENSLYQYVDIQEAANGRIYIDNSQQPGANITWAEAEPAESDFMIWQSNAGNRFAIQTSSMESMLTDGILTDKQFVPYKIELSEVISLRKNTAAKATLNIKQGYYGELCFLSCNIGGIDNGVKLSVEYADGTIEEYDSLSFKNSYFSSASSSEEDVAAVVARYNSFGKTDFRLMQYVGVFRHSIPIDENKLLKSISFISDSEYELKVLAVTARKISTEKLTQLVREKLQNLNDDKQYLTELKDMIDDLESRGIDASVFEGYSDFLELYESIAAEKHYNYADISKNANSKVYIDSSPVPGAAVPWDDFVTSDIDGMSYRGVISHRIGIQTSSFKNMTTNGIITDSEEVPYNITFSKVITVVDSNPEAELDLDNRVYRGIYFLATSVCDAGQKVDVGINYTDGTCETQSIDIMSSYNVTSGENVVAAPAMYVSWNKANFTRALTLGIYRYFVEVNSDKEVHSIVFTNTGNTNVQILAVTVEEGSNSQIKNAVRQSISNLKKDGEYLHGIKTNLDLLTGRGVRINDIEGLELFYEAYGKCVYVGKISEKTDFDITDITAEFLNPIVVSSNIVTVEKNGAPFSDYKIKSDESDANILHIVFDNTMDYNAEYTVTISKDAKSAVDDSYTLGTEAVFKITVLPPLELKNLNISGTAETVNFRTDVTNNTDTFVKCNLFVALYTPDGEMLDSKNFKCMAAGAEPIPVSFELKGRSGEEKVIVECYTIDDYNNLKFLYPDVKKEI
ncbi:MAG: hypothetical protein J6N52_14195 [Clostridia bacterium]|nr:hypothetical protein [Clostridia bacterium]